MKKIIATILVIMMILPCVSLSVGAEEDVEVHHGFEYVGALTGHWDSLLCDGEQVGDGVQIQSYMVQNGFEIEAEASVLTVRGWAMCDAEVNSFGYQINNNPPVFKDEFSTDTEPGVYEAGAMVGADYGGRFIVDIDVSEVKGRSSISVLVNTADGIYSVSLVTGFDLEFDFVQKGTESEPTPTPEAVAASEPVIVRFNSYEEVEDFFLFSNNNSHVVSIDYDEDKNCAVFDVSAGLDPNVRLPFGQIAYDDSYRLGSIDASSYKALLLIGSFDYDTILLSDEDIIGSFYYATDESKEYLESKNIIYTYERTDDLQFVVLDFSKSRYWTGNVDDCRFDFFAKTDNDCTYNLYLLGFFADANEANAFAESYKASGDSILPTPEPTPTPTNTPEATESAPTDGEAAQPTENPTANATEKPASNEGSKKKGCGGTVASIPALALALSAAVILRKKKR